MERLDGSKTAFKLKEMLKKEVQQEYLAHGQLPPKLVIISVGDDPASKIYVANKIKVCNHVGVESEIIALPESTTENELKEVILKLNKDENVNGFMLQLPVPPQINAQKMIDLIDPLKDVDGITSTNIGNLITNQSNGLCGCTPKGIMTLLKDNGITIEGKHVAIINRSIIVGKQLAFMMLNENATVTMCHSKTKNLSKITKSADIVVVAVGKRNFLTGDMLKKGSVVIDVGINRNEETRKICGDADWESISEVADWASPVPNGIGPMTTATLVQNTCLAAKLQKNARNK